ncbi:hypothetical protein EC844_12531 [Acinetobacter calcoaceticus]|uniref:Uncharacterized protein n=1 Tax=Acinetobacter calcoaceticus TaxID=471 RepID=A0A4R1XRK5_ACICA|nr:hypothetical protein EC844_12531 [Acinetobacter calcoaceticus]
MQIEREEKQTDTPSKWCDYKDGAKFLIAGVSKPAFNRCTELMGIQVSREMSGLLQITDEVAEKAGKAWGQAISHLILDWQGISDGDEPFKYDHQSAELLCTGTKEAHDITAWVLEQAQEVQRNADTEAIEVLGKSSSSTGIKTSSGTTRKPRKSSSEQV